MTTEQRLVWVPEKSNVPGTGRGGASLEVEKEVNGFPLTRVWTLYANDKENPPALPFGPVHNYNAFLEDHIHDWRLESGRLRYYSRVTEGGCWLLLEYTQHVPMNRLPPPIRKPKLPPWRRGRLLFRALLLEFPNLQVDTPEAKAVGDMADRILRGWAAAHPDRPLGSPPVHLVGPLPRLLRHLIGVPNPTPWVQRLSYCLLYEAFFPDEVGFLRIANIAEDAGVLEMDGEAISAIVRDNSTPLYLALFNLGAVDLYRMSEEAWDNLPHSKKW